MPSVLPYLKVKMRSSGQTGASDSSHDHTGSELLIQRYHGCLEMPIDSLESTGVSENDVVSENGVKSDMRDYAAPRRNNVRAAGSGEICPVMKGRPAGDRVRSGAEGRTHAAVR